jgi:hypothetical protein
MNPSESAEALMDFAALRGFTLESATPAQGIDAMIRFFQEVRPDSRIVEGAGDMLLYQWGVHDWGQGPSFQLNITRQFIELVEEEGGDEEVMSQLGLTFHFPPSEQVNAFGVKNRWCESLGCIADLNVFIAESAPYVALKDSRPERVEVSWSLV